MTLNKRQLRSFYTAAHWIAALSIFLALNGYLLSPLESAGYLGADSEEYISFSGDILSGNVLHRRPLAEVPIGRVIRPPVFPLMYAMASALTSSRPDAIFLLHATLTTIAWVLTLRLFSPVLPPFFTTVLFSYVTNRYVFFFSVISSEWSSLCLLIILVGALFQAVRSPRALSLAFLSMVCGVLALTRPVFMFLPVILASGAGYFALRKKERRFSLYLAVGLFPVLGWMSFNKYLLGTWNPSSLGGSAALVMGSMLGPIDRGTLHDEELGKFSEKMSEKLFVASNDNLKLTRVPGAPLSIFGGYIGNLHRARTIAGQLDMNPLEMNEIFLYYGLRSIEAHFDRYLLHLYYGFQSFITLLKPYCLPALIIPLFWLARGVMFSPCLWALGVVLLHVLHISAVLLTQPLINRYFELTYGLIHFTSGVVLFLLIRDLYRPEPSSVVLYNGNRH